jgi:hypothetical protein
VKLEVELGLQFVRGESKGPSQQLLDLVLFRNRGHRAIISASETVRAV